MSRVYTLPIRPLLHTFGRWETSVSSDSDPIYSFLLLPPSHTRDEHGQRWSRHDTAYDVFEIREALFAIRTPDDALEFFRSYGPWQVDRLLGNDANTLRFSALLRRQEFYRDALLHRPTKRPPRPKDRPQTQKELRDALEAVFLWRPLPMELLFGAPFVARVVCKDIEDAIRASVFLDRLEGFSWRRCVKADCGKPFRLTSKREKLYCTYECAHHQAVRDYNERRRSAKKKITRKGKG